MIKANMIFLGTVLSMTIDFHAGPFLAIGIVMILKQVYEQRSKRHLACQRTNTTEI